MNKEKIVKILIPLVALVVVVESVVLVSGLNNNVKLEQVGDNSITNTNEVDSSLVEEQSDPVAEYVFKTDTTEMKVGKSYKITLNLFGKEEFMVDAIETYIKFDPDLVSVSKLTPAKSLPAATTLKVDDTSGLISAIFLVPTTQKDGIKVSTDETKEVLTFSVTPKMEGSLGFELVTTKDVGKLVTVLPETGTSKSLSFETSKLDINVTK